MFKEMFKSTLIEGSIKPLKIGKYELSFSAGEPGESGYIMVNQGRNFIGSISLGMSVAGVYEDLSDLTGVSDSDLQGNKKLDKFVNASMQLTEGKSNASSTWHVISNEGVSLAILATEEDAKDFVKYAASGYYKNTKVEEEKDNYAHWKQFIKKVPKDKSSLWL